MKKIFTGVIAAILALTMLVGCGKTNTPAPEAPVAPPTEEMTPVEDNDVIDPEFGVPSEDEEEPITIDPSTNDGEENEDAGYVPETPAPAPTEAPAAPETPAAPVSGIDLQAFFDGLADKYEMAMTGAVEGEMLDAMYPGLSSFKLLQCVAQMPMISAVVSEYVFVQCENAEDAKAVQAILQNRVDEQANGGAWYPEAMEGWAKAIVFVKDNYVLMIADPEYAESMKSDFLAKF